MNDADWAKAEVLRACHELVARGLVARTWGNVSCRVDGTRFAITPSGIGYDRLTTDEIVVVNIESLEYAGEIEPSSEKGIHAAAYRLDLTCGFVVHTHQTAASVASTVGLDRLVPRAQAGAQAEAAAGAPAATKAPPEVVHGGWGGVGRAAYGLPGSRKLMENVVRLLDQGIQTVLMERHGALIAATDSRQAFDRAAALEAACSQHMPEWELLSDAPPKVVSVRGSSASDALHAVVFARCPDYRVAMRFDSPIMERAAELIGSTGSTDSTGSTGSTDSIPAMLDDFAQMGGFSMPLLSGGGSGGQPGGTAERTATRAVAALRKRNCAYVRGEGLICCAVEASDCEALRTLAEKNALTFLVAHRLGRAKGLPPLDRLLMRRVYLSHYSKKK
jgi:L-fuculose-phosphate aldolase